MTSAYVLGLFDTGLAVVRALARSGVDVRGFDHRPGQPGFHSRFGTHAVCPDPVTQPQALLAFLRQSAHSGEPKPILYPTSDAYVSFVSDQRGQLEDLFVHVLPSPEAVAISMNKAQQYALAESIGIPIAQTFSPTSPGDVSDIARRLTFPVIVKPLVGHLWRQQFRRDKALRIETPTELEGVFTSIFAAGQSALIQSLIVGPNTNHCKLCAYIGATGDPLAVMCMGKVRQYPVDFGVGTMMESVENPTLVEMGLRFMRAMQWRGPGSIEFKRDDRDGVWRLIELNPRLWQQNGFATDCGVNFPMVQYREVTGEPAVTTAYRAGIRWIDEFRDPRSAWAHMHLGLLSAAGWLSSLSRVRSFALFATDDLGPFWFGIRQLARAAWRRVMGRAPLSEPQA